MSITTFQALHVDELYLEGKLFTPANFTGPAGDSPVDADGTPGIDGKKWKPIWDDDIIASPAVGTDIGVYTLPNPEAVDMRYPIDVNEDPVKYEMYSKTMFQLSSADAWRVGSNVGVFNHKNEFQGRFYRSEQTMIFILVDNIWKIS